jgi:hypothetical protein
MSTFKSDKIDIILDTYQNLYAGIPTGALVPIAGPVSLYSAPSVQSFIDLGLLPCNGSQWSISTYLNLYTVITNNGSYFPFGANTNGSGSAGSTHFVLPNMYNTKYFLRGGAGGNPLSVSNTVGHTHPYNVGTGLSSNGAGWNHYHNFSGSSDAVAMNAHNHTYPAGNASTAGNGLSIISKADASGPTASSTSHSHGALNMNASASENQNAGNHSHTGNTATSTEVSGGSHSHIGQITTTPTFNSNSVAVYPSFVNMLYFIKS